MTLMNAFRPLSSSSSCAASWPRSSRTVDCLVSQRQAAGQARRTHQGHRRHGGHGHRHRRGRPRPTASRSPIQADRLRAAWEKVRTSVVRGELARSRRRGTGRAVASAPGAPPAVAQAPRWSLILRSAILDAGATHVARSTASTAPSRQRRRRLSDRPVAHLYQAFARRRRAGGRGGGPRHVGLRPVAPRRQGGGGRGGSPSTLDAQSANAGQGGAELAAAANAQFAA